MANKVGPLIKKARTDAGFTQEQLAKKVTGVTASDISKAERGEKELSQTALKQIAKATGVTQTSLLEAAKKSTYGEIKPSSGKTSSASGKKSIQVTAAEKKLLELYRAADADTKKAALQLLKGENEKDEDGNDLLSALLNGAINLLSGK